MLPRGDRDWNPHASYHSDGTLHIKSSGDKVIERKNQPLTGTFRGNEDLGSYAGRVLLRSREGRIRRVGAETRCS